MKTKITDKSITDAGHDIDTAEQVRTLCAHLDCQPDDLSLGKYDHYGLPVYSLGRREYAIGTDSEADAAAAEYVKDSLWAFSSPFILEQCGLPFELAKPIGEWQATECESANDTLLDLVKKCTTLAAFTDSAISADGRGHFLSSYDGEEYEEGNFFIYRTN